MKVSAATIRLRVALMLALWSSASASAVVIVYEGNDFPENLGWERSFLGNPARALGNGLFLQSFPAGGQAFYRRSIGAISELIGRFFFEWRAMATYPEWMIDDWQVPAVVAAGGGAGVLYHTVMTESAAVLLRDVSIERVIVPIPDEEPHTYRIEVYSDVYRWYIDGVLVDSGVPEGPYPDANAEIVWGSRQNGVKTATTAWDYIRFGRIPDDASGDYDSGGSVGLFDYYFVHDCLTKDGPGIFGGPDESAGPGCRFTDFDADADTDLLDFAEFQNLFTAEMD